MATLSNKIALVTGAGSGIGRATAHHLADLGAVVIASDIDGKAAEATAADHENIHARTCDVTSETDVQGTIAQILAEHGRLDVAHNNAGWEGPLAKLVDVTQDDFDKVLAINLRGVFLCLKHELRAMIDQGSGSVINTASVAGLVANQGAIAYSAAKHGVIGLTRTAAAEVARKGVRVNAVCPGWTDTPMAQRTGGANPKVMEGYKARVPAGRLGEAHEVAALVGFLASDEAAYINGAALPIDGGWTAV